MRYSNSSSKSWEEIGLSCLGVLALIVILVAFSAFLVTLVWSSIVPTIFPVAVTQGYLPASLTMIQALKLSILFWALGLTSASVSSKSKSSLNGGCAETALTYAIAFVIAIPIWAILVAVSGAIIHFVWGWVVPDVFSGAVALKVVPAQLSFWHSCLLTILFSVLGLSNRRASSSSK